MTLVFILREVITINDLERLLKLNEMLIFEMPRYKEAATEFPKTEEEQKRLFRSLINLRPPIDASNELLTLQDEYLAGERERRGVVSIENLVPTEKNENIYLWQGDITRLSVDGIVNAANSALLGCFIPCHSCIDNAIHSSSGIKLRLCCDAIMKSQGFEEETGRAKITPGFNLPAKYVLHTVGPIISGELREKDREMLGRCYRNVLLLAIEKKLDSIAFCCISTGEFCFPNDEAARIAVAVVEEILREDSTGIKVIFNVFKEKDRELYRELLGEDSIG